MAFILEIAYEELRKCYNIRYKYYSIFLVFRMRLFKNKGPEPLFSKSIAYEKLEYQFSQFIVNS